MFNKRFIEYLKEYIVYQNDHILILKEKLKELGYNKPIHHKTCPKNIMTYDSAYFKLIDFISSLKKENIYTSIELKGDYYNKCKYELTISFEDSKIYQKKITEQTADYINNSMYLKESNFINIKTDKEICFIKKENIRSIHLVEI